MDAGRFERLDETARQARAPRRSCSRLSGAGPALKRITRGSISGSPSTSASSLSVRLVIGHVAAADTRVHCRRDAAAGCASASPPRARSRGCRARPVRPIRSAPPRRCRRAASASSPRYPVCSACSISSAAKAGAVDEEIAFDDLRPNRARAPRRSRCRHSGGRS